MALGPWIDDGHVVCMTGRTQTQMGPQPLSRVLERAGKSLRRMEDPTVTTDKVYMPFPDACGQGWGECWDLELAFYATSCHD